MFSKRHVPKNEQFPYIKEIDEENLKPFLLQTKKSFEIFSKSTMSILGIEYLLLWMKAKLCINALKERARKTTPFHIKEQKTSQSS